MQPASAQLRSILILRYSALGDVVLATSILDPLRARFPEAQIEWAVDSAYAPLLEGLPQLARVHAFKPKRRGSLRRVLADVQGRFDLAIDLQNKLRTRLLAFAASERTIRYVKRSPGEALLSVFGRDVVLNKERTTDLYAQALAPLGIETAGRVQISLSERARAEAAEAMLAVRGKPVAIAPGSRWAAKRWPPDRFARVAEAMHERGAELVLIGGPGDADVLEVFRRECRAPLAADLSSLSVEGLAAGIARSRLLIACDSGPVHIATAVGVPSVVVFGPTSVRRWAPPPPSVAVSLELSCSPCTNHGMNECPLGHHNCLRTLEPARVITAAERFL